MEKNNSADIAKDRYIRLSDLFYAVWDRIIILIVIGAVVAGCVFAVEYMKGKEVEKEGPSYMTYLELHMGPKANITSGTAYSELFLSDNVIKKVIDAEGLDISVKDIRSYLYAEEREGTLFRLVVLSPKEELTEKIAKGMATVGLSEVAGIVDSSQMTVIQFPGKPKPVKSDIEEIKTAYAQMAVKVFPSSMVYDWETYYTSSTSLFSMIKKGIFAGVAGAGAVAVCFLVVALFNRKLRYPEDIEYASDMKVILSVDQNKKGISMLAKKLLDFSDGDRSFLFLGGRPGDGTTTMAEAAVSEIISMGEQGIYVKVSEVKEDLLNSAQGYVIADADAFGESYEGVSKSKWFDATVLVISEDSLDAVQLNRMSADLKTAGANIIGIILNKANVKRAGRKSRYYGSYYGGEK